MKSHTIEQSISQVSAADEIQSLASRQSRNSMPETGSRAFAICARIAVGILYFACFAAAIAQSPEQAAVRSRSLVMQLAPRPVTAIAEARQYFRGDAQANMVARGAGISQPARITNGLTGATRVTGR